MEASWWEGLAIGVGPGSVQFSCSVLSHSLWSHGLQHTRLLCPTPTPRVFSDSCPLGQWCYPTISSSVVRFSSCLQSLPASGSWQMSQVFTSDGQITGASASVLSMNTQDWFPLGWTALISLLSKGLSRVFSNTTGQKHQFFSTQLSLLSNSHTHTRLLEKKHNYDRWTLVGKVISLLFNQLSNSLSSKEYASFNFMAAVTICSDFGAQENQVCHCHCFPIYFPWRDGTGCYDLSFLNVEF